jgi:putative nucleotidyltransferase with HDIG domain
MSKESPSKSSRVESLSRSVRSRRQDLAERLLNRDGVTDRFLSSLLSANSGLGLLIAAGFALLCTLIIIWSRDQPLVAVGRTMDETRLVRVKMTVEDEAQTARAKQTARQKTPRVYVAEGAVIDGLTQAIENIPRALASVESIDAVDKSIRQQFNLSSELLAAIRAEAVDGKPSSAWISKVSTLAALLKRRPLLDQQTYQKSVQEGTNQYVNLMVGSEGPLQVFRGEIVDVEDKALPDVAKALARDAGFTGAARDLVVNRLLYEPHPTFTFDETATTKDQNSAAEAVGSVRVEIPAGQVIFQRGDTLTQAQLDLFRAELAHYGRGETSLRWWARAGGIAAAAGAITLALTGYTVLFCPRIRTKSSRTLGVAAMLGVALAIAVGGTATSPQFVVVTSTIPTVFVAMLMCIAYDRRSALAYGLLHGLLVCLALRETVGTMAVMIAGIACVVWTLREIRDRNSLFRSSTFAAAGISASSVVFGLIERPLVPGVWRELAIDAAQAAGATLVAGGVALFVLPMLERIFNVTTGLTLMELRDPKQPLLRELQVRAPGTYTHSLNVASIAEAAAEAIGADSLLTYVGALYHDVGKMNKPEYFVENQSSGINKHDKLSPAMSLLIIVGHVKDGLELAREFRLPRNIQHFIEAHHGTTLVEFFFARARQLAQKAGHGSARDEEETEPDDVYIPDEFEYRYPGPRPRTRECAILMISDAVESAARALDEPTPSRIEAIVRSIANRRLLDGQFDDCELTLRELNLIVESISRTLASMFHSRIAYPTGDQATSAG